MTHFFRRFPGFIVGSVILLGTLLFSVLAPLVTDTSLEAVASAPPSLAPSGLYLLGTDAQGRDMLSVLALSIVPTLKIGVIAGLVGICIGLTLGLLSGFFGGPLDAMVILVADSLMTVPSIAILIIISTKVEDVSVELMGLIVALLAWMGPTRTIRAQVLSSRERAYTAVARANGSSELALLFREVLPNLLPFVAASFVSSVSGAILASVGLEALGLGARNVHTLGNTIYWARRYSAVLRGQWWWYGPPILVISLIFIALFLLSASLDQIANPAMTRQAARKRRKKQGGGDLSISSDAPSAIINTDTVVSVQDLRVVFKTNRGTTGAAVDSVSFSLNRGECMGLVGESGCGKTTLAMAMMSLIRPPGQITSGGVFLGTLEGIGSAHNPMSSYKRWAEQNILELDEHHMRRIRLKGISLVPQAAMNSLNPVMRVHDQIADAINAHQQKTSRIGLKTMIEEALTSVGLPVTVANRFPHQLSGGMKQRVAMCIATVLRPQLIIADEPTSALDVVMQRQVMLTLRKVQKHLNAAMILIGHDMGFIAQASDSIGVLYAGQLVERGPTAAVLEAPRHPYTHLLSESLPGLDVRKPLSGIPGLPPELFNLPCGCRFHPRCPYAFDRCITETPAMQLIGTFRYVACHLYPRHSSLPVRPANKPDAAGDMKHTINFATSATH